MSFLGNSLICGVPISRMAKTIIDAVLGLRFDDSPSNLAAACLLYVLTSDVSCSICLHLFYSSEC